MINLIDRYVHTISLLIVGFTVGYLVRKRPPAPLFEQAEALTAGQIHQVIESIEQFDRDFDKGKIIRS